MSYSKNIIHFLLLIICTSLQAAENKTPNLQTTASQCKKGDNNKCFSLGLIYYIGKNTKKDYPKASKFFSKSCDNTRPLGCVHLGVMYDKGRGVKEDSFKAVELFNKSCNHKNYEGCFILGAMKHGGRGTKQSYTQAAKLFTKSCNNGYAEACLMSGISYEKGEGVSKNISKARRMYGKACDKKLSDGCKEYARLNKLKTRPKSSELLSKYIKDVSRRADLSCNAKTDIVFYKIYPKMKEKKLSNDSLYVSNWKTIKSLIPKCSNKPQTKKHSKTTRRNNRRYCITKAKAVYIPPPNCRSTTSPSCSSLNAKLGKSNGLNPGLALMTGVECAPITKCDYSQTRYAKRKQKLVLGNCLKSIEQ